MVIKQSIDSIIEHGKWDHFVIQIVCSQLQRRSSAPGALLHAPRTYSSPT